MSSQLRMQQSDSAASSQSTYYSSGASSSSCSAASPSPSDYADSNSGGSSYGDDKDSEWRHTRASGGRRRRRAGRRRRGRSDGATVGGGVSKKKMKNAREKERVLNVRKRYEELSVVLGDRVERGSGHFSKVRTLTAAIQCIEELIERRPRSVTSPSPPRLQQEVRANEPSPHPCSHYQSPPPHEIQCDEVVISSGMSSPGISLSCEERLEPATHNGTLDIFQGDISPTYSATPYFSYSSPSDFPHAVIGNSSCMFPFPAVTSSPGLPPPPSSSLLSSPTELPSHTPLPSLSAGSSTEYPLSPFHCGPDVWLAIGCN